MSKPILYYSIVSPPVRGVLLTAAAIGLELELKEINLAKGEHLSEEYTKINPQHTVPTLVDNGKAIWDSHAIATYLIGKYAKDDSLYPKDLYQRALIDQRLYFDCGVLFNAGKTIIGKILREGAKEITAEQKQSVFLGYDFLEAFLADGDYLVGNKMTVADLSGIAIITTLNAFIPVDQQKYPQLINYIKKMEKLPYYKDINQKGVDLLSAFVKGKLLENNK